MAKTMKWITLSILLMTLTYTILTRANNETFLEFEPLSFNQTALLTSNRFTQEDTYDDSIIENYESMYQLKYTEDELIQLGFTYTLDNSRYRLYFEPQSFSVIIYDKLNDYMMSSRAEFQGIFGVRENNTATRNLMNSGLWISYVRKANVLRSTEETKSLYALADVSYVTDGSVKENQDRLSVFEIEEDSYDEREVTVHVQTIANALEVYVDLKAIDASLKVRLSLSSEGLHVQLNASDIVEESTVYALTKVSIFPFFGSTRENLQPGYMVIPDGSGALVRFNAPIEDRIRSTFYGSDLGLNVTSSTYLSLPIIGMIHSINHHGYYVRIDEGSALTQFEGAFWSSNSKFNRASLSFQLRPIYRTIINQAGDGRDQVPTEITDKDYQLTYVLLGEDANYSGIATHYQTHLRNQNLLPNNPSLENVPLLVSLLMGDQTPSFLGTSYLSMTTPSEAISILDTLKDLGVEHMVVELLGWSVDGHMDRTPYRNRDISQLKQLLNYLEEETIDYAYYQEYSVASELTRNVLYNRDVAFNYSRLKMTSPIFSLGNRFIDGYSIFPERARDRALDQALTHVSMPYLGRNIFSYFDDGFFDRVDTLTIYDEIVSPVDLLMMTQPSLPFLTYVDYYLDMPIMHSNLYFYTDQVPLIPMVLYGIIPYFAPSLNFNALGDLYTLQMIDYGMFPKYVLTHQPTEVMRETRSNIYFTTTFDLFKDDIQTEYQRFSNALGPVLNALMVSREMISTGVAKVTYSNGVEIIINYTNQNITYNTTTIDALSYEVIV